MAFGGVDLQMTLQYIGVGGMCVQIDLQNAKVQCTVLQNVETQLAESSQFLCFFKNMVFVILQIDLQLPSYVLIVLQTCSHM